MNASVSLKQTILLRILPFLLTELSHEGLCLQRNIAYLFSLHIRLPGALNDPKRNITSLCCKIKSLFLLIKQAK